MPDSNPQLHVRSTAIAAVGGRKLMLAMQYEAATEDTFTMSLLPGPTPLDLTALLNQFLSTSFNVSLPAFVPDIAIDTITGTVRYVKNTQQHADPPPKRESYYSLTVSSQQTVGGPFGSTIPISLHDFQFSISSATGAPSEVIGSAQLELGEGVKTLPAIDALLAFSSDGGSLVGFKLNRSVSSAMLITQVLKLPLGPEVQHLLPTFSPSSPTFPMRLYQANKAITITKNGHSSQFLSGFNVDDVVVSLLDDRQFAVTLQVDRGFALSASLQSVDLGFVTLDDNPNVPPNAGANLGGPLINVTDQTPVGGGARSVTVSLASQLKFFNDEALTFPLTAAYAGSSKTFSGTITINQNILGAQVGTIGVAWDKTGGFRITHFPIPFGELSEAIDFGREVVKHFKKTPGSCGAIPEIKFNQLIQTTFNLSVAPTFSGGQPGIKLTGNYQLQVTGFKVAKINFQPVTFSFEMPSSFDGLGHSIVKGVKDNASTFIDALIADQENFTKFLGLVTLTTATQRYFNRVKNNMICRYGQQAMKNALSKAGSSAMGAAGSGAMLTLGAAVTALVAAGSAVSFFDSIADCITGKQRKEEKKAKDRQTAALATIQTYLHIKEGITASYAVVGGRLVLNIGWVWGDPSQINSSTSVLITVGATTITKPAHPLNAQLTLPAGSADQSIIVSVQGQFAHEHSIYSGNAPSTTVNIPALEITNPVKTYDHTANSLAVAWSPTPSITPPHGPTASIISYTVELRTVITNTLNLATSHLVLGMRETIPAGSALAHTFDLVPTTAPLFWPDPGANYEVWISLTSTVPDLNAAPWKSDTFHLPGGVDHTLVGLTFKIDSD